MDWLIADAVSSAAIVPVDPSWVDGDTTLALAFAGLFGVFAVVAAYVVAVHREVGHAESSRVDRCKDDARRPDANRYEDRTTARGRPPAFRLRAGLTASSTPTGDQTVRRT